MSINKDDKPVEDIHTIPTVNEETESEDRIVFNNNVVSSIVKMAALEVDGTYSVGNSIVDGLSEIWSGKKSERGVLVSEDDAGNYVIEIHVEMRFGVELAKTAMLIQQRVRQQVKRMTTKDVAKIDVIIDGIRMEKKDAEEQEEKEPWHHTHTD